MAKRDIYHNTVKQALITDGWIITHDLKLIVFDPVQEAIRQWID
jgi:hypothetical protein